MWPVKFKPVAMERIWGGDELKPMFGATRRNEGSSARKQRTPKGWSGWGPGSSTDAVFDR